MFGGGVGYCTQVLSIFQSVSTNYTLFITRFVAFVKCFFLQSASLNILETIILIRQKLSFSRAFNTAIGMSFISMISMEIAMNVTDYSLTGGAILTWWVVPIMLIVGFITPWPYNYWRLKKYNIACH